MPYSPLFSVCVTTYNRRAQLQNCLASILNQTYRNFEIIVVDDCSTDETNQYLNELMNKENRIRYFRNDVNKGLAANRNKAINEASGQYFTFLDDDDCWDKRFLEDYAELVMRYPKQTIFCGGHQVRYKDAIEEIIVGIDCPLSDALLNGYAPSVGNQVYPVEMLREMGGYNTAIKSGVDHDLWIRLAVTANPRLISSAHGYTIINPNINDGNRMTTNYESRQSVLNRSLDIWHDDLEKIRPGFSEHMRKCYKYHIDSKFASIAWANKQYRCCLKMLKDMPFKRFYIYRMMYRVKNKLLKYWHYYAKKKRTFIVEDCRYFEKY